MALALKYIYKVMHVLCSIPKRLGLIRIRNKLLLQLENVVYAKLPEINGRIRILNFGSIKLGYDCIINSSNESNPIGHGFKSTLYVLKNARLTLGNNVGISNTLIYCAVSIDIEEDVMIGGGCQIFDTDFHSLSYTSRIKNGDNAIRIKPVLIKKGAFIGCNSILLKGVTIGERSIIGAGSVVRNSVPDNEMWAGNPAVFIKKIHND